MATRAASTESAEQKPIPARQAVQQAQDAAGLAEVLRRERERIREQNAAQPTGGRTCRVLSDLTDLVIQRIFALALPQGAERERVQSQIVVAATGGYGRRELCAFSDIDVTFIVAEEEDPALDATVRQMYLTLMEVFSQRAQLKVGYAYRTLGDVPQLDHQTQTALLDARAIVGSVSLCERFTRELMRNVWPAAFVRQKLAERAETSARHGGTIYRVEPHVRESPGGLRDLHVAEWLAALAFPVTRGDVWRQLQRLGVVARRNVHQVAAAREFLLTVRNWMHFQEQRPADLLVRERQEVLAQALGFPAADGLSPAERLMRQYYEHAENVLRVTGFVVDRCLSERLSLTAELVCVGRELAPAYPGLQVTDPVFLIQVCEQYQAHGLFPGTELRRMIAEHLAGVEDLSGNAAAGQAFLQLLGARAGVYDTLRLMADLGILQRLIPELGEAYRRVPFDPVHRHTIGHHSLEVVRALEQLHTADDPALAEYRRIGSEVVGPETLYLAALLHDIGKLHGTRGHAEAGAEMAHGIARRLGMGAAETQEVAALVRHHLLMSEISQLRDLTYPQTLRSFTAVVHSLDLLKMLFLLTYADMAATGVLTPVKVRFLEDLFYRAEASLSAQAPPPDEEQLRRYRTRLSRRLSAANFTTEQIREHCEGMPVSYLLNTAADRIAAHIRMIETLAQSGPVVEFASELGSEITNLTVCTYEEPEPGLLSHIAGVLYAHDVSIYAAQVYTRSSDPKVALDTLWVDFHGRRLPPTKRIEVEQDVLTVLRGAPVDEILARFHKQLPPPIPPDSVRFNNDLAEHHSVLEISVADQPGLLYRITRSLARLGWDIHSARISTTGARARDAFYLTDAQGQRLLEDESHLVELFLPAYMAD
ncbi:MAG: HD domain-containing protein [Armatimonadetes bacterium]|nr:HD domain-containing protein [Armatimonadota bacterium]